MRLRLMIAAAGCALLAGCATTPATPPPPPTPDAGTVTPPPPPPPPAPRRRTGLLLSVQPPDAELIVGGVSHGRVSELASRGGFLPLPPGIYQVSLKHTGYQTWRAEVAVTDKPEPLEVQLTPRR